MLRACLRPSSQNFEFLAPDPRADGGSRRILVSARCVRIERQVSGIEMQLAVPLRAYTGITLTCDETAEPRLYCITLAHPDPDLSVELHRGTDSPEIISLWRNWSAFFGTTPIYGDSDSAGAPDLCRLKRLRPRRRGALIPKRRPRFLKRRRGGQMLARGCGRFALG